MSYEFYTLPQNTYRAAFIPITNTPTPLASLTIEAGSDNDLVTLRVNVCWFKFHTSSLATRVLFKIWRGAPVTGELICSVQDGTELILISGDNVATTDFSGVVSGLTPNQPVTFVLTAETEEDNAYISGPLTFTAYGTNLNILSHFQLPNNSFGGADIPLGQTPVPVAAINVDVKPGQDVILRSTACWIATGDITRNADVLFKLWRGAPVTGVLIAGADDSVDLERVAVTSFSHVDTGFATTATLTYVLTAEAPNPDHTASIVGALTLTGSVQPVGAFFTLPQNTAESVSIPITAHGTPLAAITLETYPGLKISLRAAIGWLRPRIIVGARDIGIIFKIWRGAPGTGSLIYSTVDSGQIRNDNFKVTALAHVDSGFTASGPITYTLTAELLATSATGVNVTGPLTFTAVPEN
ncbi:hypothetical protein [Desulfosporosinus youngiae]|uniref:Uncharacterized protein n=1 Tax=Desulfosporosinus youngiae DSM 17734 TaxID=768710 RepID=H5Y2U0_9FIRM|nr:hypothetical protein [Desulfosporosinus youngiae]EHQ88497.1 hypothetical protein DesyoDRAFT_1338 [Desulfosporosinus youngiae DSM 17734]